MIRTISGAAAGLLLVIAAGCGTRPLPPAPRDITAGEALRVLRGREAVIRDFNGRAEIAVEIDGSRENAGLAIRYVCPDNVRLIVSVTLGISVAVVTAIDDSVTVYDPRENIFMRVSRSESSSILDTWVPDARLDPGRIPSLFSVSLPPPGEIEQYQPSLENIGRNALLTLSNSAHDTIYRYLLAGPDLRVVEEYVTVNGETVWSKQVSEFDTDNGVVLPTDMTVSDHGRSIDIAFSRYAINTGMNTEDLEFAIPSSAERMYLAPR